MIRFAARREFPRFRSGPLTTHPRSVRVVSSGGTQDDEGVATWLRHYSYAAAPFLRILSVEGLS